MVNKKSNSYRKGMKPGSKHNWKYSSGKWNEIKRTPNSWDFTYVNSKKRAGKSAPKGSGMPEGYKLNWHIKANQYAIKTGPNSYKLIMRGKKFLAGYKKNKDIKWRGGLKKYR